MEKRGNSKQEDVAMQKVATQVQAAHKKGTLVKDITLSLQGNVKLVKTVSVACFTGEDLVACAGFYLSTHYKEIFYQNIKIKNTINCAVFSCCASIEDIFDKSYP